MWHGKCLSKFVRLASGTRNEMSKRFFHKFLLNDTFAPAERFNPRLALGTVGRNVPGGLAGAISFS
jgi:hypothetical protein